MKFNLSGFIDTYHAFRSKDPYDFMSSRSRLRTEFEAQAGKSYLFASINSIYNNIVPEETKIELREAFFQYTNKCLDIKAGKQIVIWGVADGLRITDIVSPMDYSEFLARDYDDIRIPVNAVKMKYVKPNYNFEFLFIPIPEFFIMALDNKNPWSITSSYQTPYEVRTDTKPEKTIKNCEAGGRFSFYMRGIDFSISALRTWNKMPVYSYTYYPDNSSMIIQPNYKRLTMLGSDISIPINKFVIRGEFAEYFNELQDVKDNNYIKKSSTNFLLGIDWYPGYDWNIMLQYYHKYINNYDKLITGDEHTSYGTVNITKKLIRNTLKLSTYAYIDIKNNAFFDRTYADYALTDQIHLTAGYDWFHGNKGMFSYYKNNSEYFFKAKYNF